MRLICRPPRAPCSTRAVETPKPGALAQDLRMIAAPQMALEAAARAARALGLNTILLGDALEGEAREMGVMLAGMARSVRAHGHPVAAPAVLLSGGETTVSIGKGPAGKGGRNTELMLGFALCMAGAPGVWGMAGDSDGIDGSDDAAGAIVAPDTLARARAAGLDARAFLAGHDSYTFFDSLGDLIRTGPTFTNVNDIAPCSSSEERAISGVRRNARRLMRTRESCIVPAAPRSSPPSAPRATRPPC
jgi:glycerate 2-kinase